MKRIALIIAIAVVVFTAPVWTQLLLQNPAVEAFALSDRLWLVMGIVCLGIALAGAALMALASDSPSPTAPLGSRQEPEGHSE